MIFLNKYITLFGAIVLTTSTFFFLFLFYLLQHRAYAWILVPAILYPLVLFLSGLLIGRRDKYDNYLGLNYHVITYLSCNAAPVLLYLAGYVTYDFLTGSLISNLIWGIILLVHFVIFLVFSFSKTKKRR